MFVVGCGASRKMNAAYAELYAVLHGLQRAKEKDSHLWIGQMTRRSLAFSTTPALLGPWNQLSNILELANEVNVIWFSYLPRNSNQLAHCFGNFSRLDSFSSCMGR